MVRGVHGPGGWVHGPGGGHGPGGCMVPGGCMAPGGGIPACTEVDPSPVNRMTGRCKNITLPQTSFAGGKYWSESKVIIRTILMTRTLID